MLETPENADLTKPDAADPASDKPFDYMQAGNESNQAETLAQEYMGELMQTSAPATYLPVLINVLADAAIPKAVKVRRICC